MLTQLLKWILSEKTKRSIKEKLGVSTLHYTLVLLKGRGYYPQFVIDGGAYEGHWTQDLLEVFPDTRVLMLEAQAAKLPNLQRITEQNPNVQFHQGVLSAEEGRRVIFSENETASHVESVVEGVDGGVSTETLDGIIVRKDFSFPDFIKLDVQGYELEVLKGATECLAHAEFCLLEVSLLNIGNEPLLIEVINFMDQRGFQSYDICQLMRRPYDQALYQIDLLFVKKNSRWIKEKRWD